MTRDQTVKEVAKAYAQAMNDNDFGAIEFTPNAKMNGPLMGEPRVGADAIKAYLHEISPFIARFDLQDLVVEGDRAVLLVNVTSINGVTFSDCTYLRFEGSRICEDQAFFDPSILLRGRP